MTKLNRFFLSMQLNSKCRQKKRGMLYSKLIFEWIFETNSKKWKVQIWNSGKIAFWDLAKLQKARESEIFPIPDLRLETSLHSHELDFVEAQVLENERDSSSNQGRGLALIKFFSTILMRMQ